MAEKVQYGGFWLRLVADGIDTAIFWLLGFLLSTAMLYTSLSLFRTLVIEGLICFIAYTLYEIILTSKYGGTIGKILLCLKVTDENGKNISYARATGRYFSKFVSTITFGIGYLMIGWTAKKQGLHDKIASTFVKKDPKAIIPQKARKIILWIAVLLVIGYFIYVIGMFSTGVWLGVKIATNPVTGADPIAQMNALCKGTIFPNLCFSTFVTHNNQDLTVTEVEKACSLMTRNSIQAQCYTTLATYMNDQAYCSKIKTDYRTRICQKTVMNTAAIEMFFGLPNPDGYASTLQMESVIIGVDREDGDSGTCLERADATFYADKGERICFQPVNAEPFQKGLDGFNRFDMDVKILDSNNVVVDYAKKTFGDTGYEVLTNNILNDHWARLFVSRYAPGNYTYQLTVYDIIGKKKAVAEGKFTVV